MNNKVLEALGPGVLMESELQLRRGGSPSVMEWKEVRY